MDLYGCMVIDSYCVAMVIETVLAVVMTVQDG
jgi:hypothetical protein